MRAAAPARGTARTWESSRRRLAAEHGYTLSELLVVLAILGIVLGALTTLFVAASNAQRGMSDRYQAQQHARLALDALRREIHCARTITPVPPSSSITVTLGRTCPTNRGTALLSALTIPGSGSFTITAADTSSFLLASGIVTVRVGSSAPINCTGVTATTFTGCTGGTASATPYPVGTAVTGTATFTWCTKDKNGAAPPTAGAPYTLWRYAGAACSGTGRQWASYIADRGAVTSGRIFQTYTAPNVPAGSGNLATLSIDIPVNTAGSSATTRWYELRDDIVLRNSGRS